MLFWNRGSASRSRSGPSIGRTQAALARGGFVICHSVSQGWFRFHLKILVYSEPFLRHCMRMGKRREARERAVQFLFEHDLNPPEELEAALTGANPSSCRRPRPMKPRFACSPSRLSAELWNTGMNRTTSLKNMPKTGTCIASPRSIEIFCAWPFLKCSIARTFRRS
jgi:hypothetical protein